ncbi:MAG TPA: LLM class flavin-dependent oxidoreductase [Actinomycetota bacterium]|nr:LLM class flavin-dependent oxidoreductase [Actinomycetota bacterium]
MSVRIGLGLFTGQIPPGTDRTFAEEYRDIVQLSRLAEAVGFDSVWVSEHHGSSDGYLPSLLPILAGLATATERVLLGTGVMLTPFHHPLRLAEDAAVVDQLSDGRLILGLGLGWRDEEFRMFGVPPPERVRRTVETVDILRKAWTGDRFSHDGKVFSFDKVKVTPRPAGEQGPPIYLGGMVEQSIRRAGRLGDGYIRSRGDLDSTRQALAWADEGAREGGKAPGEIGFAFLQNAFVWEDGDAWEVVQSGAAHQLGVYAAWREGADTPDVDRLDVPSADEAMLRKLTPAGDRHEVIQALRPLVDAFGDRREFHLVVRLHYPGMDFKTASRAVELFGEEVVPALKGS